MQKGPPPRLHPLKLFLGHLTLEILAYGRQTLAWSDVPWMLPQTALLGCMKTSKCEVQRSSALRHHEILKTVCYRVFLKSFFDKGPVFKTGPLSL